MTNFVLLYTGGWGMGESEEEQAAVKEAWGAWFQEMGEAVVDGTLLGPSKNLSDTGVSDGPSISGYQIISADSLDDALAKVKDHPHLKYGGQLSVHQTFQN
jgi:hypothetical protein